MSKITVVGDVTIDRLKWNGIKKSSNNQKLTNWELYKDFSEVNRIHGGAMLLAKMIGELKKETVKKDLEELVVIKYDENLIDELSTKFIHTMCDLRKYKHSIDEDNCPKDEKNRVENFIGFPPSDEFKEKDKMPKIDENTQTNYNEQDIVLIHDADNYFRRYKQAWPNIIKNKTEIEPLFIHKMHLSYASGDLWKKICEKERKIIVIDVEDLRKSGLRISRSLSWERTAYNLKKGINNIIKKDKIENPDLRILKKFMEKENFYLIVRFGIDGAILYQNSEDFPEYSLIFDPDVFEGSLEYKYPGYMNGLGITFVSGLAFGIQEYIQKSDKLYEQVINGIKKGIIASRDLYEIGFKLDEEKKMNYPFKDIFPIEDEKIENIQCIEIKNGKNWKIIEQKLEDEDKIYDAASQFVKFKKNSVLESPVAKFGKLSTADRSEIESYHSIKNLISEYLKKSTTVPLSIAIFGPPGSGKSFGVTEIAKTISEDIKGLEFNLSQFESPQDLFSAFHMVQSTSLEGKIPLVFFDEFDCNLDNTNYGWLRYFLSPMHDGKFKQGNTIHPIGKAIFVFAGGTSDSFAKFSPDKKVKGPDFKSRLRGFVNIVGINSSKNTNRWSTSNEDSLYMIRRAITLRTMLEETAENIFDNDDKGNKTTADIDSSVLNALIKVPKYKHGIRSMKAIIEMSILSNKKRFDRSALPSSEQLELHVDAEEFKKYLNE